MRIVDALFSEVETTKWSFCGQFRLTTSKVYKRSSISLKTLMPSIYIRLQKYWRNNCVVGNIISIPSTHEEKCEYSLHTTMHLGVSMSMSQCGLSELKEKKNLTNRLRNIAEKYETKSQKSTQTTVLKLNTNSEIILHTFGSFLYIYILYWAVASQIFWIWIVFDSFRFAKAFVHQQKVSHSRFFVFTWRGRPRPYMWSIIIEMGRILKMRSRADIRPKFSSHFQF